MKRQQLQSQVLLILRGIVLPVIICTAGASITAQIPSNIPKAGIVAFHDFNGSLEDKSGGANTFVNNGVLFEEQESNGKRYHSARFNGTPLEARYLEAVNPEPFKVAQYSHMTRFKVNEFRPLNNGGVNFYYQAILAFCPPNWTWGAAYSMMLNQVDNSALNAGHWTTSRAYYAATSFGTIKLDEWFDAITTYDGSTLRLYVNGSLMSEQPASLDYANQVAFVIGGAKDGTDGKVMGGFSGNIDEFAFWNRALTNEEIERIYNPDPNPPCLGYRDVDSLTMDTKQEVTWTSTVLKSGVRYRIVGSGVWTPNGGFSKADCEYEYFEPCTIRNRSGGVRIGLDLESALSDDRKLRPVAVGIDCDDHTYVYEVTGDGRPLYVLFRDIVLSDNVGLINVKIQECLDCSINIPADSILGYRSVETHEVVTYALRNNPKLTYQWTATGGYLLGETNKHFCDVIWGYDNAGSVCCIVNDSTCSDTICVTTSIQPKRVVSVSGDGRDVPSMTVRPNPASETIEIVAAPRTGAVGFELVNATGNVVYQASGAAARMDVSDIPVGVYHIVQRNAYGEMIGMQRVVIVR